MSTGLPAALRDAIARFAQDVAPKDLASRAASLTENYRGGTGSETAIRDDRDVAAYLTTRLPATYAAMAAALRAVKDRAPHFTPARLLDVGSGPGTASWAASDIWPLESITMLDRNPHLLAAARVLAQSNESLARAEVVAADLNHYPRKADASLFLPSPLVGEGVGALRSSARPTEGGLSPQDRMVPEKKHSCSNTTSSSPATPSPSLRPKPANAPSLICGTCAAASS